MSNKVLNWLFIIVLAFAATSAGCVVGGSGGLNVVTGTSQLSLIALEVGGDKVTVTNFVPPGVCPGQCDVKPGDIRALTQAKVLIIHDYQQTQRDVKELVEAARNPSLITKVIAAAGGLMTPQYQTEATDKVAAALAEVDPANAAYYHQKATERKSAIAASAEQIKQRLAKSGISGIKVVASGHQADFLKWAGFTVAATYMRPEDFTPALVADVLAKGKAAGAVLVVDNLQSGPDAGQQIARDLKVSHVTLSNFPGAFPNTETWVKAADENLRLLLTALGKS